MTIFCLINITRRPKSVKTILFLQRRVLSFPNRRRKEFNYTVKDGATVFYQTELLSSRSEGTKGQYLTLRNRCHPVVRELRVL